MRDSIDLVERATLVEHLGMSLEDQWMFAMAPCSVDETTSQTDTALLLFANCFVARGRVSVRVVEQPPLRAAATVAEITVLEQAHEVYDLYLWFAMRCPKEFPEHELATALRQCCAAAIDLGLQRSSSPRMRNAALRELKERSSADTDGGELLLGLVDGSTLEDAILSVIDAEAALNDAGYGEDNDPDGVFNSVVFKARAAVLSKNSGYGSGKPRDNHGDRKPWEKDSSRDHADRKPTRFSKGVGGKITRGNEKPSSRTPTTEVSKKPPTPPPSTEFSAKLPSPTPTMEYAFTGPPHLTSTKNSAPPAAAAAVAATTTEHIMQTMSSQPTAKPSRANGAHAGNNSGSAGEGDGKFNLNFLMGAVNYE